MWDESVDKFTLGLTTADGTSTGNITLNSLGTLVANLEGNVTGTVTGTVSSLSNHDTGDLAEGSNLYYTDARVQAVSINNVVEDTTPQLGGDLASNGNNILFADSDKAIFGAGSDLQIYHDASGGHSRIDDTGTGGLVIRGSQILLEKYGGGYMLNAVQDGAVTIHYAGSEKLATTSTGVDVTGTITSDGLTVDNITIDGTEIDSNTDLTIDAAGDIALDADGGDFRFKDAGTTIATYSNVGGDWYITANSEDKDIVFQGNDGGSTVQALRLDMSEAGKATFNDAIVASGISQFADVNIPDNNAIRFGNSQDLQIFHNASDSIIYNATGALMMRANDFRVQTSDASSTRLTVNSTGVDVTGTVVADGLTSSGNILLDGSGNPVITNKTSGAGNNPVYRLQADTNYWDLQATFSNTNDDLYFMYNGSVKAGITSSGNLGIGTTSPSQKLHVYGGSILVDNGSSAGTIYFHDTTNYINLSGDSLQFANNGAERMRLDSSGNLAIGTTSVFSGNKLDVRGGNIMVGGFGGGTDYGLILTPDDGSGYWNVANITGGHLTFNNSSTIGSSEKMRLDSSGNLGIGTTSPVTLKSSTTLQVDGNAKLGDDNGRGLLSLGDIASTGANVGIWRGAAGAYAGTGNYLNLGGYDGITFTTGNADISSQTERMRINSAGGLGIGTTAGTGYQLDITGQSGYDDILRLTAVGTNIGARINLTNTGTGVARINATNNSLALQTGGIERMRIASTGEIQIGGTSSAGFVDFDGTSLQLNTQRNPNTGSFVNTGKSHASISMRGADGGSEIRFYTTNSNNSNAGEKMRLDSSGNLGIGVSPSKPLHIYSASDTAIRLQNSTTGTGITDGFLLEQSGSDSLIVNYEAGNLRFSTSNTERARIDSSGNLLVGTTITDGGYDDADGGATTRFMGASIGGAANGTAFVSRRAAPLQLNRQANDGDIAVFRKEGSEVGAIGANGGHIYIAGQGGMGLRLLSTNVVPADSSGNSSDGTRDLGGSLARFKDIYATNGTIQTSDRNEKQDIAELTDAETRVAVAAKGLLRKFRWQSAVEEKADEARIHFGIIAQDLQDAFTAEGLDAGDYAMFISSTWTDEETGEEKTRLGVRYSELLAFIIASI
jgi:hypothetical protein